jgi:hypothetical protein
VVFFGLSLLEFLKTNKSLGQIWLHDQKLSNIETWKEISFERPFGIAQGNFYFYSTLDCLHLTASPFGKTHLPLIGKAQYLYDNITICSKLNLNESPKI